MGRWSLRGWWRGDATPVTSAPGPLSRRKTWGGTCEPTQERSLLFAPIAPTELRRRLMLLLTSDANTVPRSFKKKEMVSDAADINIEKYGSIIKNMKPEYNKRFYVIWESRFYIYWKRKKKCVCRCGNGQCFNITLIKEMHTIILVFTLVLEVKMHFAIEK